MDDIWARCLDQLRTRVKQHAMETWLKPIRCEDVSESRLLLSAPNNFVISWIKDNYIILIEEVIAQITGTSYKIVFESRGEVPSLHEPPPDSGAHYTVAGVQDLSITDEFAINNNLNPRNNFKTFVVGACNQFAHAAAKAVVENLGGNYNPLFIYGGVGLGKTHLMNAIGYEALSRKKDIKLSLATSEEFTNEMINAIRYERMVDFRNKYRNIDLLMIDDIQFFAGKQKTQEEFFHTFNRIYETRKQIVVTADCFPNELSDVEQRLKSRFSWGLVADIGPPDLETKIAILKNKAAEDSIVLPDDVAVFLAKQVESNVRDLLGNLIRVIAMSTLQGIPLTLELAERSLKNVARAPSRPVTVDHIITHVSKAFNVKVADIKSKKKQKIFSLPRQISMYLARELTQCSYPEIAAAFAKDHTTVIYASRKVQERADQDESLKSLIEGLKKEIRK